MDSNYSYDQLFTRNRDLFSDEEQRRLRRLRVAVAGAGGLGGAVAVLLARLGIGALRIADPETFEPSNLNRQFGAYVDTVGRSKAEVIGEEARRCNPFMDLDLWSCGVSAANVDAFLRDMDCVVDAVEFFGVEDEVALHRAARSRGLFVFTGQAAGSFCTYTTFHPERASFEDLFVESGRLSVPRLVRGFFPVLPPEATPELVSQVLAGTLAHIPSTSTEPALGGALVVRNIVELLIRDRAVVFAPDLTILDLHRLRFLKFENGEVTA